MRSWAAGSGLWPSSALAQVSRHNFSQLTLTHFLSCASSLFHCVPQLQQKSSAFAVPPIYNAPVSVFRGAVAQARLSRFQSSLCETLASAAHIHSCTAICCKTLSCNVSALTCLLRHFAYSRLVANCQTCNGLVRDCGHNLALTNQAVPPGLSEVESDLQDLLAVPSGSAAGAGADEREVSSDEDTSDEAFSARHAVLEAEEQQRFNSFAGKPCLHCG